MVSFNNIREKLQQFIKKYYTNELIKGFILFAAFGLLYFIFTLFIEHFLWLRPSARSILFFGFILVELALLARFIALPLFKLMGLQKGISLEDASKIIGNHFPEVDDKLLNVLQLNQESRESELLMASIEQKAADLQPIPFKLAINFKNNAKYLKYLAIPLIIWLFTLISGNNDIFKNSLDRVVHYKTAYEPPAPFMFKILNKELTTIEGETFEVQIETIGDLVPENAKIYFNEENYFLRDDGVGRFTHVFTNVSDPILFYVEANGVRSKSYELNVLKIPTVVGFEMFLNYPNYTKKSNETVKNSGNAVAPEGTTITWNIRTQEAETVTWSSLVNNETSEEFNEKTTNVFTISKQVRDHLKYKVSVSNGNLKDYEKLNYAIQVIKDEYPEIAIKSDVDSVSRGPVQFVGQLSDDYGLSKLNLVYYDSNNRDSIKKQEIEINKTTFEEFYYVFDPKGDLNLEEGKDYEVYFEAFDNDGVNGSKSVKSKVYSFRTKTKQEISEDILKEQKESLDELDKAAKRTEKLSKDFEEFSKKIKNKPELNWNDKNEMNQFLKRQEQYQEMFEEQTQKLKENLDEQGENDDNQSLKDKKEELQKRIKETAEMQRKEKLLEELEKMAEKLDKEGMLEKLDKLTEQNKQSKRSLERLLELTKRYYVEKKATDIADKLDALAKKQEKLSDSIVNTAGNQEKLNEVFEDIKKGLDELEKENLKLQLPMDLPDTGRDEKEIEDNMKEAKNELNKLTELDPRLLTKKDLFMMGLEEKDKQKLIDEYDEKKKREESLDKERSDLSREREQDKKAKQNAQRKQKSAAKKMKEMSSSMKGAMMEMQGRGLEENIDDLRAIVENLVSFSLDQEQLMLSLDGVNASHASYPRKLKKQQILKEHFEHIDDSLYTLSLRLQELSVNIQKDITEAHYNIDKSLENIAENRMRQGISNQQYTMTAANNLADVLSDMLNSLQNPSMGSGKGGGGKPSVGLPDIIEKQKGLNEKMKDGVGKKNKGGKEGENGNKGGEGQGEKMTGEQYQIYQEQQALRKSLEELIEKEGHGGKEGKDALDKMKMLEEQLLDKGFDNKVLERMLQLEHELLKLKDARLKQGMDSKRKADSSSKKYQERRIKELQLQRLFFNPNEILNRQPLPLHTDYKNRVREYFKESL